MNFVFSAAVQQEAERSLRSAAGTFPSHVHAGGAAGGQAARRSRSQPLGDVPER